MSMDKAAAITWDCLERAVAVFNNSHDRASLLGPRYADSKRKSERSAAGERAITHRLAFYLELELLEVGLVSDDSPIAVDCEYNRHSNSEKSVAAEAAYEIWKIVRDARKTQLVEDDDGFYVFSVAPDLIVHQRLTDDANLLVVEVKKRSNRETTAYDDLKLKLFTAAKTDESGYGYCHGAWIVAEDEWAADERRLRIVTRYKDGKGCEVIA